MKANSNIVIEDVQDADFAAIRKIYAHYVENTTISLEEIVPGIDELKARKKEGYPYFVAKINGEVVGYAYAFEYRQRSAYKFTVEESIYISPDHGGHGVGGKLLKAVIEACKEKGFRQMVAVIAGEDNILSIRFHESLGFKEIGRLKNSGYKMDKWVDTIIMQKPL